MQLELMEKYIKEPMFAEDDEDQKDEEDDDDDDSDE